MIIFALLTVIIFIIFTFLLPQILYIVLIAFIGYVICKTLRRKQMGQMIIILSIFIMIDIISAETIPLINKIYPTKQDMKNSIEINNDTTKSLQKNTKGLLEEEIQESINEKDKNTFNKVWSVLNKYPNKE